MKIRQIAFERIACIATIIRNGDRKALKEFDEIDSGTKENFRPERLLREIIDL